MTTKGSGSQLSLLFLNRVKTKDNLKLIEDARTITN